MQKTKQQVDEIDKSIIAELQNDANLSSRKIAAKLGIAHSTIRRRINNLVKNKMIQIVAVPNWNALGYNIWVQISIKTKYGFSEKVAEALKQFNECYFIAESLGRFDIIVAGRFISMEDLVAFVRKASKIRGIESSETQIHFRTHRYYDFDMQSLTG